MNQKFLLLITILFFLVPAYAMQSSKKSAELWFKINDWKNITEFADHVIAYTTDINYFGADQGCPITQNSSIKFGYINPSSVEWEKGQRGYQLYQLIKTSDHQRLRVLINSKIQKGLFFIRSADMNEIDKIRELIRDNSAQFEYSFDQEKVLKMLERAEEKWN